jgi:hypothetical protein
MMSKDIEGRIAAAEQKAVDAAKRVKQLKAQREALEARKLHTVLKGQRADDTRRKILVGSAVLSRVEKGEWPKDKFLSMLDGFLTRPDDRALFDLPAGQAGDQNTQSEGALAPE